MYHIDHHMVMITPRLQLFVSLANDSQPSKSRVCETQTCHFLQRLHHGSRLQSEVCLLLLYGVMFLRNMPHYPVWHVRRLPVTIAAAVEVTSAPLMAMHCVLGTITAC